MGILVVGILLAFIGLIVGMVCLARFSNALWWLGIRRSDLPEGSLIRRADDAGANIGGAFFCIFLACIAAFYVVEFFLPWLRAHAVHGGAR